MNEFRANLKDNEEGEELRDIYPENDLDEESNKMEIIINIMNPIMKKSFQENL